MSRGRRTRWMLGSTAVAAVLALAAGLLWQATPWPRALLIRHAFAKDGLAKNAALSPRVPPGVTSRLDLPYLEGDPDAYHDIHDPPGAAAAWPLVVWVHGGAFVAGDKREVANYCRILAARGFAVAAVNYALAPAATHPKPVAQLNEALAYLQRNAAALRVDPTRRLIAGDSAGAQIASQYGLVATDPGYAERFAVRPAIAPASLRGLVLCCGPYDAGAVNLAGPMAGFLRTVMWSYSGTRNFAEDPVFKLLSTRHHVTAAYPPDFITSGNGDPLTPQSKALAQRPSELGVAAETLFFPDDHRPSLPHEYQFVLDLEEARDALERIAAFAAGRLLPERAAGPAGG